jgi:hypothetical protein
MATSALLVCGTTACALSTSVPSLTQRASAGVVRMSGLYGVVARAPVDSNKMNTTLRGGSSPSRSKLEAPRGAARASDSSAALTGSSGAAVSARFTAAGRMKSTPTPVGAGTHALPATLSAPSNARSPVHHRREAFPAGDRDPPCAGAPAASDGKGWGARPRPRRRRAQPGSASVVTTATAFNSHVPHGISLDATRARSLISTRPSRNMG